jgi:murein DD-endopeptidase MepM/ murein hydrolase activator NlpD
MLEVMTISAAHLVTLLMLTPGLTGSVPATFAAPASPGVAASTAREPTVPVRPRPRRTSFYASGPVVAAPSQGVWPLTPRPAVVAAFDPPLTRYGSGHRGVDLAGEAGQRVRAAVAGRVTFAGSVAGRGVVVVSHGATRTTYEPVEAAVDVGTDVSAGQPLGTLQAFSSHCAPAVCLHWGLVEGDSYLDPLILVGGGPVRLLPLSPVPLG